MAQKRTNQHSLDTTDIPAYSDTAYSYSVATVTLLVSPK